MVHFLGVCPREFPSTSVSVWIAWSLVTAALHGGQHGHFQPADRHVHRHLGPCWCSYPWRVWSSRCPLGRGSGLSGHRLGLGVCIWGQRASANPGRCAVWCEYGVCACLWKVHVPCQRAHMRIFLYHSLSHNCLSSLGWSWWVRLIAFLSSFTFATSVFSITILPRLSLSAHNDEHPLFAHSHWFIHTPLLGVTQRRVWRPVGLRYDQTCRVANIHQRPSVCTSSLPVPLLPPWPTVPRRRGTQISSSASPASARLPEPSPLPSVHTRPLPVFLLAPHQSTATATQGPHTGLFGFCRDREELLFRFINTGVTSWV